LGPNEFMERLLAAHGAEDALEPRDEPAGEPDRATADPAPSVDPTPILGLLGEAERLCGIDVVRLRAAAAA
ncbi:MAG: hypothetical protein QOJ26_956, partial [Thermoplasmata archaeon]|nr:hypothetical protein [Thermoplasmata archaeon]